MMTNEGPLYMEVALEDLQARKELPYGIKTSLIGIQPHTSALSKLPVTPSYKRSHQLAVAQTPKASFQAPLALSKGSGAFGGF